MESSFEVYKIAKNAVIYLQMQSSTSNLINFSKATSEDIINEIRTVLNSY